MAVIFFAIPLWMYFICCLVRRFKGMEEKVRAPLEREVEWHSMALRDAMQANDAKTVFLAALSHELRTPLSGISGVVQLLQDTHLDTSQREYARMIAYANTMLLEILDDMLNFSRIEAGKIEVEYVAFSVHAAIDDMLSLQTIQAQERGIALIRDISPDVPAVLLGDRRRLNQILLNTIGNGIKFTDEGSVTVSVACQDQSSERVRLTFQIVDTGIGVPEDMCQEIFKPFVQVEANRHGRRGGTGLGLAICQRLLHTMGGDIKLESTPHRGTRVSFYLDFDIGHAVADESGAQLSAAIPAAPRELVVLLVEDDEINRLVCTRYLALCGHHPLVTGDGRQVMHVLQGRRQPVDAILMDMNLPGTSGIDLVSQIREMDGGVWKDTPVLMMSAEVSGDALERSLMAGISAFLRKPFTLRELNSALQAATEVHAGAVVPAPVSESASIPQRTEERALLDVEWLESEMDALGVPLMLELLNIFRSGVAGTLAEINHAAALHRWDAVAAHAHRLQGSAANLGMIGVQAAARALREQAPDAMLNKTLASLTMNELEARCHDSCDELRLLLAQRDKGIAFVADSD
ncbi:MAG TPA: ATP-binding protein [Candidimonas sp.]|nr:ATP-binding protein [Candidimonas sp.]